MSHKKSPTGIRTPQKTSRHILLWSLAAGAGAIIIGLAAGAYLFEKKYEGKTYPNVYIGSVYAGGKTQEEIRTYWQSQNVPFENAQFTFVFENTAATLSGSMLEAGYDASLSAAQAYAVGRSGYTLADLSTKLSRTPVVLSPYFRWKTDLVDSILEDLAKQIDIPVQDALFQFDNGRVTAFRVSKDGRQLNIKEAGVRLARALQSVETGGNTAFTIPLPVEPVKPAITTNSANAFGIREIIGKGYSEFSGSIPGRIHNVILAASRLNGILIPPGETFSFNDSVGDISAATGYQSAYIIKDGRTVLGDGGGVCQVSSTMFRAALNAGLPIVERQAHAYRVHYYEDGGFKPGLDATVFSPSVDLKFKNNTPAHILIQAKPDKNNLTLTFELYGTSDGRVSEIYNHVVGPQIPPPPPLYQDDPTLAPGVVKQVDFASWGAKASFQYKVTRGGEILEDTTFVSNFRPWQAVYLRGPQTE